ncbi:bile acid:sodium symporter family protein [Arvimicrobium flavum]|uniref:bile acid:sodium symporter family protein n=1 Tax=Arvimicrobium flavum TaxID=3393320 RepID=UPI00237C07CF|nr:bile acid:sodium symporter family protein [Mesorhizobium shangrilense]
MKSLSRFRPDNLVLALLLTATIATLLPVHGKGADYLSDFTIGSVALLFFLHGARLMPQTVLQGFAHWRLHLTILACTFVMFPLLSIPIGLLSPSVIDPAIYMGFIYLCILPSTIQSSIAFTSIAGGNVAGAVVAASSSNMLGVVLTPVLATLFFKTEGGVNADAVESIAMQLLLPFVLGQLAQRWIGGWVRNNRKLVGLVERGSILCVVYLAFSDAITDGVWFRLSALDLLVIFLIVAVLLAVVLYATRTFSRLLGFSREDEITIVFCGSKKSMGSGLPMANIIFAGQALGLIVLPMIIFHQLQLMVCAGLAKRYAAAGATKTEQPNPVRVHSNP